MYGTPVSVPKKRVLRKRVCKLIMIYNLYYIIIAFTVNIRF